MERGCRCEFHRWFRRATKIRRTAGYCRPFPRGPEVDDLKSRKVAKVLGNGLRARREFLNFTIQPFWIDEQTLLVRNRSILRLPFRPSPDRWTSQLSPLLVRKNYFAAFLASFTPSIDLRMFVCQVPCNFSGFARFKVLSASSNSPRAVRMRAIP